MVQVLAFELDPDIMEKTGDEVATLGEQLESVFGWKTRTSDDGVIPIVERQVKVFVHCTLSSCVSTRSTPHK